MRLVADPGGVPSGGYVLINNEASEFPAGYVLFDQEILSLWGFKKESLEQGGNPITPCEAAMIPLVMLHCLPRFIDRQVIMFVDNSVSLLPWSKAH